jgi:acetylornithine deacetylase/succinyl-diaminopimelate desuccinylase-like protein
MAVAFGRWRSGSCGTLVYLAVADEENLGTWGRASLAAQTDAVLGYVVTEAGGSVVSGPRLPVIVGEKGSYWCRIAVRDTGARVATVPDRQRARDAAEIVRRLASTPPTMVHDVATLHRRRRLRAGIERLGESTLRLL